MRKGSRADRLITALAPALAVLVALTACTNPEPAQRPDTPSPTAPTSPPPSPTPTTSTPVPDPGPTSLPPDLLGTDWERIPTADRVVALTFDGGASDAAVSSILGTLTAKGVEATFFLTGDFARSHPESVAAIAAAGHRLGNHSDTHAHYPQLRDAEIAADLSRAEEAIVAASGGHRVRPLFRFPYGDRTAADVRAVNAAGYVPVRWTVDTLGWRGTSGGVAADDVVERVVDTAKPGQIVLMHLGAHPEDGSTLDADALPAMIDELRRLGYSFVTLDTLLN